MLHFGTDKCVEFAKRYFAIGSVEVIARDVASCRVCTATKVYARPTQRRVYYELIVVDNFNETISMDLYEPLPKTARQHVYVLVQNSYRTERLRSEKNIAVQSTGEPGRESNERTR